MPVITLVTNVKLSEDESRSFVLEFIKFASETLQKAEDAVSVNFSYNPYLAIAKTFDPAVRLYVISLRNTNPENVEKWTGAFAKFFESRLGVPIDRGLFVFNDPGEQFVGARGTSVATLWAKK